LQFPFHILNFLRVLFFFAGDNSPAHAFTIGEESAVCYGVFPDKKTNPAVGFSRDPNPDIS
jgi:hypothetical protein